MSKYFLDTKRMELAERLFVNQDTRNLKTHYERELSRAMETLDKHFAQWHRQKIDCFELNDRIHRFHQNTSSELWKTYSSMEDDFLVCRAVKLGFLSRKEVSEKVAEAILLNRPV